MSESSNHVCELFMVQEYVVDVHKEYNVDTYPGILSVQARREAFGLALGLTRRGCLFRRLQANLHARPGEHTHAHTRDLKHPSNQAISNEDMCNAVMSSKSHAHNKLSTNSSIRIAATSSPQSSQPSYHRHHQPPSLPPLRYVPHRCQVALRKTSTVPARRSRK